MSDETCPADIWLDEITGGDQNQPEFVLDTFLSDDSDPDYEPWWSNVLNSILLNTWDYAEETVEHLIIGFILYFITCLLLYVAIVRWHTIRFKKDVKNGERVLVVIAHPDDECMFFGPTILNFTRKKNCLVYLMCMSTGQNYGMGKIRKKELYGSCKVLGIDEERVIIQVHSLLPDDKDTRWPSDLLADMILQQVEVYNIDTLITFDKHGVSRHVNHCSLYYAIVNLRLDRRLPDDCTVYVLDSINLLRKYWLVLDIPLCFILSSKRYILNWDDRSLVHKAMKNHKSQLVWFRKLYMIFSRYMVINTLQEMDIIDIELDLEVDDD